MRELDGVRKREKKEVIVEEKKGSWRVMKKMKRWGRWREWRRKRNGW